MVPTPYLIGVGDSFMTKVRDFQVAETWLANLDTKQVCMLWLKADCACFEVSLFFYSV